MVHQLANRRCDRCGTAQTVSLFDHLDYISGETFTIVRCVTCGLVRTDFSQETIELGQYYGTTYYGNQGKRFLGIMEWMIGIFRKMRVKTILRLHPMPGIVLDVGCGRGLMLIDLQTRGWLCFGTELSNELADQLKRHDITVSTEPHLPDNNLPAGSFDVITLWHSLEHVEHPAQTLDEVVQLLKPGGIVIVEVPNLESWQAFIGKNVWFHLDAPRHLYHFSASTLRTMLEERGLRPLNETTLSLEQGFYGMYQTLLNRLTTQPNVLYLLLKKRRPRGQAIRLVWDIGITLLLLLPIVILGTLLEALSILFRRGAVVRMVAVKDSRCEERRPA